MSDINPIVRLPLEIQEEIENLRVDKQNALMITKIIESKYATSLVEQGFSVPTFNDINKYIKWAKKNRGVVPQNKSVSDYVMDEMDEAIGLELQETKTPDVFNARVEDTVLQTSIDLSTPKSTLEDVKKRLQLSIQRLEKKRISLGDEYNDKLEQSLRGYYVELSRLTHTEVKMAEELKDSDKVDVATVNFILNKLFQCVALAITEVDDGKKAVFFSLLKDKLRATKNDLLAEITKELTND